MRGRFLGGKEQSTGETAKNPVEKIPQIAHFCHLSWSNVSWNHLNWPWPSNPCFFGEKKKQGKPRKMQGFFLFAEPLKSLEKKGKTHKKAREIGKRKKQGNWKKQGLEGQGSFMRVMILKRMVPLCRRFSATDSNFWDSLQMGEVIGWGGHQNPLRREIFLAFLCAFFLPFPRSLGVPRREKPLLFFGVSLVFFQKKQGLGVRKSKNWLPEVNYCNYGGQEQSEQFFSILPTPKLSYLWPLGLGFGVGNPSSSDCNIGLRKSKIAIRAQFFNPRIRVDYRLFFDPKSLFRSQFLQSEQSEPGRFGLPASQNCNNWLPEVNFWTGRLGLTSRSQFLEVFGSHFSAPFFPFPFCSPPFPPFPPFWLSRFFLPFSLDGGNNASVIGL